MYKFILIILITANFTFASGHSTTIYDCAEFSGENQAAVHVVSHSTSPPGGPVKSWTEAISGLVISVLLTILLMSRKRLRKQKNSVRLLIILHGAEQKYK
jgi:membrane associated rhomboid family serine protease